MTHNFTLKNLAATSVFLVNVINFGITSVCHAQTAAQEQGQATVTVQTGLSAAPASSGQDGSSTGWSAGKRSGWCPQSIADQEDFLCKVIRVLTGPDSSGPNRDVDENISAGGAGG
ncbi:hypothetical protein [Nitrosovibrio sp. Nv4]|uniref:hypothetical protein n=1 Tax=Nitrosovibrio sp. Nv4 TaxID=1945880 RepID=UPI000BD299A5|nr:hypothetical protein [Nitrosovibrio sp. Nv4]SOD40659.1 hypothetical protein SAMN06298226_0934 [Nitrosovibrio sp. Nv4]